MEVYRYNPSVSFADSSPYTGEPLARTASTPRTTAKTPCQISNLSVYLRKRTLFDICQLAASENTDSVVPEVPN